MKVHGKGQISSSFSFLFVHLRRRIKEVEEPYLIVISIRLPQFYYIAMDFTYSNLSPHP